MRQPPTREQEQAELEYVLASGTFAKSQNLARLLRYLCRKYFEGHASDLKEFNIGVEALGRLADDFDPTSNSVVRVELHRLRERLKRYYEAEGLHDSVVIVLKPGNYTPQFLTRSEFEAQLAPQQTEAPGETPEPPEAATKAAEASTPQVPKTPGSLTGGNSHPPVGWRRRFLTWLLLPAVALIILAAIVGLVAWKSREVSSLNSSLAAPPLESREAAGADSRSSVRILAGHSKNNYTDHSGQLWGPDRFYTGGLTRNSPPQFIDRTSDPTMYQNWREGEFSYDIPLKPGVYELGLYFAETIYGPNTLAGGGEASRTFNVALNGKPLLTEFDPIADAGANNTADKRVFVDVAPAGDGKLHLQFSKFVGPTPPQDAAILNAVEVVPGIPGKMRPVRIVAQTNSYTDHNGQIWTPDLYASQGRLALHNRPVDQTQDSGLFYGERYGHFSYAIPVALGRSYGLTLYFAETYFGAQNPAHGGAGSRLFDVYCNGVALLRNFDIFKEAGGADRAVLKTFHGLPANPAGKLLLTFVPVKNYACVNAIEVVDETK